MARYGSHDDQNSNPDDDPTQIVSYGAYGDQPPPGETPWYRKPVALVASGAVGAVLVALVVYGLAMAITGGSTSDSVTTTSLTPLTPTAVLPPETVTETVTATTTPETTTTTTETTTTTTTTTEPTTTAPSVSTSIVTQTETETVTEPPPAEPEPQP